MSNDPRVEAVARIIRESDLMPGNLAPPLDLYLGDAQQALINADEADRAAGIVRVRVDDLKKALAGVYENQSSMCRDDWGNEAETIDRWYQDALIAALTEEQP